MDNVLSLGEKIVMAARLAAIEHVRQEIDVRAVAHALAASKDDGVTDDSDVEVFSRPVSAVLKDVFGRIEAQHRRRAGAA